jgi:hypothetical protein
VREARVFERERRGERAFREKEERERTIKKEIK